MINLLYYIHLGVTVCGIVLIYQLARHKNLPTGIGRDYNTPVWLLPIALSAVMIIEYISFRLTWPPKSGWDYINAYYPAGQAVLTHPDSLHALLQKGTVGFVNIPIVAYLFAPLAMIPAKTSLIIFSLIGLLSIAFAWFALVHLADLQRRERWLLAVLFVMNGPLMSAFKYGNLSYFILAALAGGLLLLRRNRPGFAGVLLGIATVIKPPLALFGFFFLFRREWRALAGYAAAGLTTALLSLFIFGWDDNYYWFETSIVQYNRSWLDAFNIQSFTAFIQRLTDGAGLREWMVATPPTPVEKLAAVVISVTLLLVAVFACIGLSSRDIDDVERAKRRDLQYILVICLCLISSPLTWTHYYLWMLMPIAFFLSWTTGSLPRWAYWTGWTGIIMVTPIAGNAWSLSNNLLMSVYRATIISHYLVGGLLIFGLVCWRLATIGGLLMPMQKSQSGI